MIVRTIGHGQRAIPDRESARFEGFDHALMAAIEARDGVSYDRALADLHRVVAVHGVPMPDDYFGPSDIILPEADTTLDEAIGLFRHGDLSLRQTEEDSSEHANG